MSRRQLSPRVGVGDFGSDDSRTSILHVDMDAFYASCEIRDRPELRDRPVIVGGRSGRGVVLAATYPARRFGVHSAMPMGAALRSCPSAVVLEPNFDLYGEVSRAVMAIFTDTTPLVEPLSLDEAFLDVSGAHDRPARIAERIRHRVFAEQRITCSVGVAASKFVAKVASARCKPDGLLVVAPDSTEAFLHPMPVAALWGVGPQTEAALRRIGLTTVADIASCPVDVLCRAVGDRAGRHLADLAQGRDPRRVVPGRQEKSIGAERTFDTDLSGACDIAAMLDDLGARVAHRLRSANVRARTIGLKVRYPDFSTITRSRTLADPTDSRRVVVATARALAATVGLDGSRSVRLLGVRAEGIAANRAEQLHLQAGPWPALEAIVDVAANRYGPGALRTAAELLPTAAPRVRGSNDR